MTDDELIAALDRNADFRNERWQCITDPALLTTAAARIRELVEDLGEVVAAWDWWQIDTYDRCASVPGDAIDIARATLAKGADDATGV